MAYTYKSSKTLPQRISAVLFVLLLQGGIVYLLVSGLGKSLVQVVTGPIQMNVIEELQENEAEPPPPPPQLDEPPPEFVPPPDINIQTEAPVQTTAIKTVTKKAAPVVTKSSIVLPSVNKRRPLETPDYPPSSRRAKEEGVVVLQLYINEEGKVVEAKVAQSSGFPKLDEAAVKKALRKWRFTPGKKNGVVAAMWLTQNVRFKLTD